MTDHAMQARLLLAEARVPRYTSYPTAAQFGPLEEAVYRRWLQEEIGAGDPLSVYVHVPFCRELCWYCACHTRPTRSDRRIEAYAAALLAEAELLAAALPPHGGIMHLHLGGGTPSILGPAGLQSLFATLRHRFGFRPGAELAIELDPRMLDASWRDALGELGITRASLGVQDIAPDVQRRIGRLQPVEQVADAVRLLREAGVGGVNLDLMYGLPGQTARHVADSARFAAQLNADRLAVFGYAHLPAARPHQRAIDTATLPNAQERLEQAEQAEMVLCSEGYVALGLDHFARPEDELARAAAAGRLRRNFQGYTTDAAPVLLGLGASAIGSLPGGFAQNIVDERAYAEAVAAGRLPVIRGLAVTAEDRLRAGLIERLMCDFSLDLAQPAARAVINTALPRLMPLERDGLVRREGTRLLVTPLGRRYIRQVASCFDDYVTPAATRYSVAV
ncbi:oxygen-independent coproporphyrinogen III oxidase [Belnapia rosea]|uniref:oxygen-independent coproporphyrinogen III oxidase n=1 Tax=Belnapia rosea TaxID=938405 RepID=UPI0008915471|nr:oxygen-independent coproporphyrinogen III oxidase [Belnapia rosea]SDB69625.1 oxygen-independent coproporphyrinogen-3 oxidase [Belnapia rosea]